MSENWRGFDFIYHKDWQSRLAGGKPISPDEPPSDDNGFSQGKMKRIHIDANISLASWSILNKFKFATPKETSNMLFFNHMPVCRLTLTLRSKEQVHCLMCQTDTFKYVCQRFCGSEFKAKFHGEENEVVLTSDQLVEMTPEMVANLLGISPRELNAAIF